MQGKDGIMGDTGGPSAESAGLMSDETNLNHGPASTPRDSSVRFVIERPDDETVKVAVEFGDSGGEDITIATHDDVGWAGMELLTDTISSIGEALGIEVMER